MGLQWRYDRDRLQLHHHLYPYHASSLSLVACFPFSKGPFRSFKDYETTHFRFLGRRRRLEAYPVRWSLDRVISPERWPLPAPARMTPRGARQRIEDMVVALSSVSTLMD